LKLCTRITQISERYARQLDKLARATHVSEADIIERALDVFFRFSDAVTTSSAGQDWAKASEEWLSRVWGNEADAAYDNWRELYGVPAR